MSRARTGSPFVVLALLGWLVVNLLQAAFTPLHGDEVYYWAYGWELALGYADHAPAVGLLTFLGQALLPYTELGARLFTVLLGAVTLLLLWRLTDGRNARLFFLLAFGMLIIHVGGFFVSPDSPLGLANALLLTAYATYLKRPGWKEGLAMGAAGALVLYSKYHGLVLIGMLALAQPRLWRNWSFWLAGATALFLFLPGLGWLMDHDFITFRYHFLERDPKPWSWRWTADFVVGQLALFGPFTGLLLLPVLFIHRPVDPFIKCMRISAIGILAFLFLMSFRMRVMGNWSASAVAPVLLVAYDALSRDRRWSRWGMRLALAGLALILPARLWLIAGWPLPEQQRHDFQHWDEWAEKVREKAGGRPVVFTNSYDQPARYAFETRIRDVYVLNNLYYHATQFDLWPLEERMQHREVLLVTAAPCMDLDSITGPFEETYCASVIHDFCSFQRLRIRYDGPPIRLHAGEEAEIPLILENPYGVPVDLGSCTEYRFHPSYHIRHEGNYIQHEDRWDQPLDVTVVDEYSLSVGIRAPQVPGSYSLLFSLVTDHRSAHFGRHGEWLELEVLP